CAGLAVYDIYREPLLPNGNTGLRLTLSPALVACLPAILFILHTLIVAGEAERKLVASYQGYFDVSWKLGVQLSLAVAFVAAFWALLWLGAALFQIIGIRAIGQAIQRHWFAIPATATALAYAIHITDARAELVRGVRTLSLTLLAWLLPMLTGFTVAFLLALPFTGLQPLWSTRSATGILLAAAGSLIVLINAGYQDGQEESVAKVVRYARSVAALVLVPLVGLAVCGLMLRARQYGWTPTRIIAGACIVVAGCYAAGYAAAALRPGFTLRWLEPTNVTTAYVIVAVMLCLLSPVADPARIAVADQLQRLASGKETPETFDFKFLRFHAGRHGRAELEKLARATGGPQAAAIAEKAKVALSLVTPWQGKAQFHATAEQRAANIAVVYPQGQALPESFIRYDWATVPTPAVLPRCLTANDRCEAALIDLDADGTAEVLLFVPVRSGTGILMAGAFKAEPGDAWTWLGHIANAGCAGVRDGLASGHIETVDVRMKDVNVNGVRLRVNTIRGCPSRSGGH
ncbi:MAG TPA: DUF4153 domain-containing protein, partial [Hyphomicrobiaceae bacterium]|nr:DUF4153 domain-containing protein [Hyphomicrobiaceae bacterium]